MYLEAVISVTNVCYVYIYYVCSCLHCKTMGLQVIFTGGSQTMRGALKEEAQGGEVLDLLEIGWILLMILRGDSEVAAVAVVEVEIGGPRTREVVAVIG